MWSWKRCELIEPIPSMTLILSYVAVSYRLGNRISWKVSEWPLISIVPMESTIKGDGLHPPKYIISVSSTCALKSYNNVPPTHLSYPRTTWFSSKTYKISLKVSNKEAEVPVIVVDKSFLYTWLAINVSSFNTSSVVRPPPTIELNW